MKFKIKILEQQLAEANTFLRVIAVDLDSYLRREFGKELVVTRVSDPIAGKESGIHGQRLAFDGRVQTVTHWYLSKEQADQAANYLNKKYPRYDKYKTAFVHSANGSVFHLHVQVSYDMTDYLPSLS